jgi:Concanavalin A-like lectin/glucanases superfamily
MGIRLKYQLNTNNTKRFEAVLENNSSSTSTNTRNSDFACNYGAVKSSNSYMVTMVWSAPILTMYVNGIFMATRTLSSYTDPIAAGAFGLANVGNGAVPNSNFGGWLQHASIITASLTQDQVRTLYQAGVANPAANSATVFPWVTSIVASNGSRKRITITNESTSVVWLSLGGIPAPNQGIPLLPFGGRWTSDVYAGEITAIINRPIGYSPITVLSE